MNKKKMLIGGVAKWIVILLAAFLAVGFVFLGLNKGKKKLEK